MASVSTYLNFPGNTEKAFLFYRSVFGGEFDGGIRRMGGAFRGRQGGNAPAGPEENAHG